ncbi:MAG: phosphoadenosine phosphosulfate reductase family protein [Candidatus Hodgkinia cicadicola]
MLSFKLIGLTSILTTSLSLEDQLLLSSCLACNWSKWAVVVLDTKKTFRDVQKLSVRLKSELGKRYIVCYPNWPSLLCYKLLGNGLSVYSDANVRVLCCKVRKVLPLFANVNAFQAKLWVTGVRKLQSESRDATRMLQYDVKFNCAKLNPMLAWKASDLDKLTVSRLIEHNCMLSPSYKSIGCAPCTRAVRPWEPARAGRWWWERASGFNSECGLHVASQ